MLSQSQRPRKIQNWSYFANLLKLTRRFIKYLFRVK